MKIGKSNNTTRLELNEIYSLNAFPKGQYANFSKTANDMLKSGAPDSEGARSDYMVVTETEYVLQ